MRLTSTAPDQSGTPVVAVSPLRRAGGVALAALAGAAVAVQSRINGDLGERLQDGIAAATISFGSGMVLLLLLVPGTAAGRRGLRRVRDALRDGRLRAWQCLGGACGAYFVITQGVTVAVLGVAVFTVALVAGQSGSALIVDRAGIGPAGKHAVTTTRIIGAVLAVVAVVVSVADRLTSPRGLALAVLPALAGLGVAWQQAVNGRVRGVAGSGMAAAFVNFAAGTSVLVLVYLVTIGVRGPTPGPLPPEPWLYVGGALGVLFIAVASSVVRLIGVLLMGQGMIAGQLICAVALDLARPGDAAGPGAAAIAGAALTLVAVAVTAFPPPRWLAARRRDRSA